jgi:V8-like Glu-specific endopeptidase
MRRTVWLAGTMVAALGAYVLTSLPQAAGDPAAKRGIPFKETAAVGALFTMSDGRLGGHFCTASVVNSPGENLLITAAHCMAGRSLSPASGVVFAPGYHDGRFPHGTWTITTVYVDSAWAQGQNPNDDVAFLVAGRPGTRIQRHTGAETLMIDQPAQPVQVIGYPGGTNEPITCSARARNFGRAHQMVFDCDGYTNGTSGGPFLAHVNPKTGDGWVIGVIGGYQQGGDTPNISYSPRFFSAVRDLYETAVAGSSAAGSG